MSINRSFNVTVTFRDGYGAPLELTGDKAQNVYAGFQTYVTGTGTSKGFEVIENDGSACIYLYEKVAKMCRTVQTETEVSDEGKCKELVI